MPKINSRSKGQRGEREVAKLLNEWAKEAGMGKDVFQRNTIQCAIGGSDLSNNIGLSVEVKLQEINFTWSWWDQCFKQSEEEGGTPLLFYRRNRQPWRVVMLGLLSDGIPSPVKVELHHFKPWYLGYIRDRLGNLNQINPGASGDGEAAAGVCSKAQIP